ncbi:hypothetical protein PTUN_a3181 [Pseudoalteromonas tunicata]|uniref:Uncharacterized protein n=1 Tax=Pseudoalteromonas tunicata D2 TaxID=87626 RepID=A4C6I1_9GAMM|nr:hypothetical protein PTUN_a3181 [Pseudoalteromonas tunicata]EAR29585.1 hypothetical protein PTD2_12234 [Pseudoalteromonas tunicata D2]
MVFRSVVNYEFIFVRIFLIYNALFFILFVRDDNKLTVF